jgi:hypothetical protein
MKIYEYTQLLSQNVEDCIPQEFTIDIAVQDIREPVILKYEHKLLNAIPKNEKNFCQTCVAVDPRDKKEISLELPVNTGCQSSVCKPNLKLEGELINIESPMILGETKNVSIHYKIWNFGEPAYSTRLSVNVSNSIKYASIPPSCTRGKIDEELICNIRSGKPLKDRETFEFDIILDISKCEDNFVSITAEITCSGDDVDKNDNFALLNMTLERESKIEILR